MASKRLAVTKAELEDVNLGRNLCCFMSFPGSERDRSCSSCSSCSCCSCISMTMQCLNRFHMVSLRNVALKKESSYLGICGSNLAGCPTVPTVPTG